MMTRLLPTIKLVGYPTVRHRHAATELPPCQSLGPAAGADAAGAAVAQTCPTGPYLEYMEGLKLYVFAAVFKHVHHLHEVLHITDILHHGTNIGPVQQHISQQLHRQSKQNSASTDQAKRRSGKSKAWDCGTRAWWHLNAHPTTVSPCR
eukprot:GHUV01031646.1.p1 GENE.GHUV01031646.1~~GHUV01031646.1.p1  ORF type:complete len:149 (-),score=31.66 GHUV01031646.1:55-501(-)